MKMSMMCDASLHDISLSFGVMLLYYDCEQLVAGFLPQSCGFVTARGAAGHGGQATTVATRNTAINICDQLPCAEEMGRVLCRCGSGLGMEDGHTGPKPLVAGELWRWLQL